MLGRKSEYNHIGCFYFQILQNVLDLHNEDKNILELSALHSKSHSIRSLSKRRSANCVARTGNKNFTATSASVVRQNPEFVLQQMANTQSLLCDICNNIEEYFSYPLLAIIAISFLFILFDDFYILEVLLNPNCVEVFEADEFFAFFLAQMLWYVIIIFLIVEGSSKTIKESAKSAAIVHNTLNNTDDPEIRKRLLDLSLQLQHRRVRFTAAELFNLDRTLIFTVSKVHFKSIILV